METKRDVYSLGIIIWEMLNREVVWKNKTFDELKYLIGKGDRVIFISIFLFFSGSTIIIFNKFSLQFLIVMVMISELY